MISLVNPASVGIPEWTMNTSITETSLASVNVNFGDKYRLEFGQVRV